MCYLATHYVAAPVLYSAILAVTGGRRVASRRAPWGGSHFTASNDVQLINILKTDRVHTHYIKSGWLAWSACCLVMLTYLCQDIFNVKEVSSKRVRCFRSLHSAGPNYINCLACCALESKTASWDKLGRGIVSQQAVYFVMNKCTQSEIRAYTCYGRHVQHT